MKGSGILLIGAGQSEIRTNEFIYCNKGTAGAALQILPGSNYVTDLWVSSNSFQANGTASYPTGDNIDIGVTGVSHAYRLHFYGNQFNDVTATKGAKRSIVLRDVIGSEIVGNTFDQTGWTGTGAVDVDATNTDVYYYANTLVAGSTEFVSSPAAFGNAFAFLNPNSVKSTGEVSSTVGGYSTVLRANGIQEEAHNGVSSIGINYGGYQNGTTLFRDFDVFDGKHQSMIHTDGTNKRIGLGILNPSTFLHIFDSRTSIGQTGVRIQIGAGQTTQPLLEFYTNDGTTKLWSLNPQAMPQWASVVEPTCDSSTRGIVNMVQGGFGAADTFKICAKSSAETYAWHALATIP
jgi:hypothetical protein